MTPADKNASRRGDWCAILFALLFPTLLTVVYFILLAGYPTVIQQGAYAAGKLIQFAFPVFWVVRIQRTRLGWSGPRPSELLRGGVLGLALLAGALLLYHFAVKPAGFFDSAVGEAIRQKVAGFGVASPARYVVLATFYSLGHSFLEEYYWRWFVFGRLRQRLSLPGAIGLSSLGFMGHHVCIVSVFFGWLSLMSVVLSVAVAVGGAIWAWLYHRTGSLFAPWFSHALVDAAIFLIGYDLVKDFSAP